MPPPKPFTGALALISEGWSTATSREAGINKSAVSKYLARQRRPICPAADGRSSRRGLFVPIPL